MNLHFLNKNHQKYLQSYINILNVLMSADLSNVLLLFFFSLNILLLYCLLFCFSKQANICMEKLAPFFKYWPLFILHISSNIVQFKLFLTIQTRNFQTNLLPILLPIYFFTALIYTSNCFPSLYYYLFLISVDEVCRLYLAG